jgi:acetylornithine aminotransferase
MPTYARLPVTLVRGEGCRVWDDGGNAYLDAIGGLGALSLGHAHPAWVAAVTDAAGGLGMTSNLVSTQPQETLGDRLAALLPVPDARVFLANSGAEAVEGTLKLLRRHGLPHGRPVVVTLEGSFHGRTTGALAATGQPDKRAAFEPLVDWIRYVPPGDPDALVGALAPGDVAGVLLEPVMGEGGVRPLDPAYLRAVRTACDDAGALLAVDEVQSGTGRCGDWLAVSAAGITPDVVALAKALGGGLPIGAIVAPAALSFGVGEHATTFGGGPVPSAAAIAVLDTIEADGLLANVQARGRRLRHALAELAPGGTVAEVRGRGLLTGVELAPSIDPVAVLARARTRGLLASTAGPSTIRCTPPFTVSDAEIEEVAHALAGAIAATAEEAA